MWTCSIMGVLILVVACMSAAAEPPHNVSGVLGSPLNLTNSFNPNDVEDVSWNFINNGTEYRIVTIKNGSFVDVHDGYKQYGKGTVLEIKNLTEKGQGIYIADITFLNNTMKKQSFNVTVCGHLAPRKKESTTSHPCAKPQPEILSSIFDYPTKCNLLGILSMVVVAVAVGLPLIMIWLQN